MPVQRNNMPQLFKKGHIANACRGNKNYKKPEVVQATTNKHLDCTEEEEDEDVYTIFRVQGERKPRIAPYAVDMAIHGKQVTMEIDTGAAVTIISENAFRQVKTGSRKMELKPTNARIRTYTGERISVLGEADLPVEYDHVTQTLSAMVVKGQGPCLIGRDGLSQVKLNWQEIFYSKVENETQAKPELAEVLKSHSVVFKKGMGTLKGFKATIKVDHQTAPKYWKPRPVPYSLRDKVDKELDRLVDEGIVDQVQYSDWACPIVPIVKPDGSIRVCGDYKVMLNKVSKLDHYPIPKIQDLLATIGGGQKYTKLDLWHAYLQIELDDESKPYTTISTHRGLFQYNRLPFGISSSPGIFQRVIETLVEGIPCVKARLDDILMTGPNDEVHINLLNQVLTRLEEAGIRLNLQKCNFMQPEVGFCEG